MKNKIIIFGNSASGKSTLAKKLCSKFKLSHLDLDTLAWQNTKPLERESLNVSRKKIIEFVESQKEWVIEGCYSDLIEVAIPHSSEIIFMNLSNEVCINNARKRPWEPHKYDSKQKQDENLEMLVSWISQYNTRADVFSKAAHEKLYENYFGKKRVITNNMQDF